MIILPCRCPKPHLHQWIEKLSFMSNNTQCSWERRKMFFLFPPMFALKTFPTDKSFFAFFVIERRATDCGPIIIISTVMGGRKKPVPAKTLITLLRQK